MTPDFHSDDLGSRPALTGASPVGAHPPRVVNCGSARLFVTFGGSGGDNDNCQTGVALVNTHVVPRPRLGTSLLGGGSTVTE